MRFFVPAFLIPAFALSLSACFDNAADEMVAERVSGPPAAELCRKFRDSLEALSSKAAIDYENDGTAVVAEEVWIRMGGDGRDKLGQMLAFHAACAARQGSSDQRVIVRNELGNVVARRTIDTRINTMSMIAD